MAVCYPFCVHTRQERMCRLAAPWQLVETHPDAGRGALHSAWLVPRNLVSQERHNQVMEFRSEKKCQPDHSGDSIQTKVWIIYAGARQMQITGLHGQRDTFLDEPVRPHTRLQVEFKSAAQVRRPDA